MWTKIGDPVLHTEVSCCLFCPFSTKTFSTKAAIN